MTKPIELAAITGAHGVAGEVRLKLFGEGVEALSQHKILHARDDGRELKLTKIRTDNKGGAVARFAGISGRGAAEKLRGTVLTVTRGGLPDLGEGEYYHADLIGLLAVTDTGAVVGRTIAVENFGATDIIEILREPPPAKGTKTIMVPMTKAAVTRWDAEKLVISGDFVED